ncbi:DUF554 domain-containing protein [Acetobacterium tundrae]|uniref:DUF554 family protein n=1 Tax=Acetobacterium tundrae TaxID=132932 RepID=A0ABR6WHF2_9FIRM|nr:DUF554 domain-containing protein [Acetobacterium tundrae]MBC3795580.1 DUF554 family protein [Acetobacterium tundrae]
MLGTIINAAAIVFCSLIGLLLKEALPQRLCETITQGLGLGVVIIGTTMALKTENITLMLVSLLLGAIVGELIDIEKQLKRIGDTLESKMKKSNNNVSIGFVSASLLFCTGSMAIMGALENGITGTYSILLSKSLLDGIFAMILSSTMGIGVLLSAIPVFLYQGSISLLANSIKPFLSTEMITEMNAVGGILIMAIGINMLKIKEFKVGNLLPAIIMPIIILWIIGLLGL